MMRISCGTDIIEIERIQKSIEHLGKKFIETIYTEKEIAYCESKKGQKYQHYAARFAGKEAIFKALSMEIEKINHWKDFEIVNEQNGRPKIYLKNKIENLENMDISMSHCKEYAVATVIATYKETS